MKKALLSIGLLSCIITGCTEFDEPTQAFLAPDETVATSSQTRAGATTYEFLENPYALDLMQDIYDDYDGNTDLRPTDLYVRFKPKNADQMNSLRNMGLELFDHPLDLDIPEGVEYVDPTIPEGEPTWLFTTVKPNFAFPTGITYEILEECYIPTEGESIDVPLSTRAGGSIDVEMEALYRTGFTSNPVPQTRANVKPRGQIRVWDNSLETPDWVGVKGVKIRCHIVVKWSTAYTDEDGNYTMGSNFFLGPHYAIVYDNIKNFTIWGNWGFLAAANHNMGWHSQNRYSEDIRDVAKSWDWAVANNAGYEYYEMCETTGIQKPPSGLRIWLFRNGTNNAAPMLRRMSVAQVLTRDNWATYLAWGAGLFLWY